MLCVIADEFRLGGDLTTSDPNCGEASRQENQCKRSRVRGGGAGAADRNTKPARVAERDTCAYAIPKDIGGRIVGCELKEQ